MSWTDNCPICGKEYEVEDDIDVVRGTCDREDCNAAKQAEDYEAWLDDRLDYQEEIRIRK